MGKKLFNEQKVIVDNVDKLVQNSIFPKKVKKWMCKTYPQKWGQNVDNVDNIKYERIFCAICLVYHNITYRVKSMDRSCALILELEAYFKAAPEISLPEEDGHL